MKRTISLALGLGACVWPCLAQNASLGVPHAPLGAYEIAGGKSVDHIDVQRFRLSPGARGTRATFAAPFLGYVAEGTIVLQLGGGQQQTLTAGDTLFAPANTTIDRFENASATEPATLVAAFLLGPQDEPPFGKFP